MNDKVARNCADSVFEFINFIWLCVHRCFPGGVRLARASLLSDTIDFHFTHWDRISQLTKSRPIQKAWLPWPHSSPQRSLCPPRHHDDYRWTTSWAQLLHEFWGCQRVPNNHTASVLSQKHLQGCYFYIYGNKYAK